MLQNTTVDEGEHAVTGLASSVATCLLTLEISDERAVPYLREAFAHLRKVDHFDQRIIFRGKHGRRTVASLLSFLLPDIDAASTAAGQAVRQAIIHLRQQSMPSKPPRGRSLLN